MKLPVFVDPRYHDAVIFDLDGVVTDTAALHAAAWKATFDDYLARRPTAAGEDHAALTDDDCRKLVDADAPARRVADFLATRGIAIPPGCRRGQPRRHGVRTDRAQADSCSSSCWPTVCRCSSPPSSSCASCRPRASPPRCSPAAATAPRSSTAAGLSDLFPIRVDGRSPAERDPARDRQSRSGCGPRRCVVVDATAAGVAAGRDGGFGLVLGVDRTGRRRGSAEQRRRRRGRRPGRGDGAQQLPPDLRDGRRAAVLQ